MLCLQSFEVLFQLPHFIHLGLYQRALVVLVYLLHDELRITSDDELSNSKECRDPETGQQHLVLRCVVRRLFTGKVHLDYVLEALSGGHDEKHADTSTLE